MLQKECESILQKYIHKYYHHCHKYLNLPVTLNNTASFVKGQDAQHASTDGALRKLVVAVYISRKGDLQANSTLKSEKVVSMYNWFLVLLTLLKHHFDKYEEVYFK